MNGWAVVLLAILGGILLAVVTYVVLVRPWHMSWGTTKEERRGSLPGDDLVPQPISQATHAITICAPAAEVWPWLVQMGQGRGGFYSYDWLENLFGCNIQNAGQIIPQWQDLKVGAGVRLHPKSPPLSVALL